MNAPGGHQPPSPSQLAMTAVDTALNVKDGDGEQAKTGEPAKDVPPEAELTAQSVRLYLQGITASSCSEIDALIGDLCALRKRVMVDENRIEQGIVEFATLSRSINRLTELILDSNSRRGAGE